ncbi:two pore domain potassium channel family protein [Candidatus Pacearchaeota archaeon]|nr:two pore domain potassium channel family protein [Candidatus Pacearchaeota archaeon]
MYIFTHLLKKASSCQKPVSKLIRVLVIIFLLCIAYTFSIKFTEGISWDESVWQVWQTVTTVGYGNSPAEKVIGRVVTMFFGSVGIALFAAMIEAIIMWRIDKKEKRESGQMENSFENGYVIFHMPAVYKMIKYITQIRHKEPEVGICIVDDAIEMLPSEIKVFENIHFVKGSAIDNETYSKAHIGKQKVVVIFPKDEAPESDGLTKSVVELVCRFKGNGTRIMHMLIDSSNNWLFEKLPSTGIYEDNEILLLVQEGQDPFVSTAVQQLLLNDEGANPISCIANLVIGWTWHTFITQVATSSASTDICVSPFALVHDGNPLCCPSPSMKIREGDIIIINAYHGFNWEEFESQLI